MASVIEKLACISRQKPVKKNVDLEIGKQYPIVAVQRGSAYDSIYIESSTFLFFLPSYYKSILDDDQSQEEMFHCTFALERVVPTRSGQTTSILSFYKDGVKL